MYILQENNKDDSLLNRDEELAYINQKKDKRDKNRKFTISFKRNLR